MAATSGPEKDEIIAQFIGVTGADRERASFFLDSSGWKLDVALESFFDDPDDIAAPPNVVPPSGNAPQAQVGEPSQPAPPQGVGRAAAPTASGSSGRKIATLGDYASVKRDDDSDDEEGQTFYAGGPEQGSGQQVVGPKRKKEGNDSLVKDIFKHAKDHGAEEVSSGAPSTSQGRSGGFAFKGAGYRLGETPQEPVAPVPGTAGTMPGPRPKDKHIILKMWKTGFSIDDGELRDYRSPQNDVFLRSIMKGEIPEELVRMAQGGEVSLDLEDHRSEEYVQPKRTTKAFAGSGMMLGSPTPTIVSGGGSSSQTSNPSQSTSSSSSTSASTPSAAGASVDIDPSKPVTTLQLRLADGSRLPAKFNHTHTIGDIRSFIISSRPEYSGRTFVLMTTFPNKTLSDDKRTIAEDQLMNAVIVQRLT